MTYLITQTFILLLIAALLGLILGWYLTRISAASARASLQARLRSVESDARELRAELDAATTAKSACETERKALTDELAGLRASGGDTKATVTDDRSAEVADLQAQLDACRAELATAEQTPPVDEPVAAAARPQTLMAAGAQSAPPAAAATSDPDDLQQIKGIGPKIAGILKDLGILRFEQIAAWTPENVAWVNDHLKFKGRIEREEWIPQAKALLAERQ